MFRKCMKHIKLLIVGSSQHQRKEYYMSELNIATSIKCYLDEISERLQSGHATIMVGAGFSRNAEKSSSNVSNFPNWHQLGNEFYRKLNGRYPREDENYLNALKLAEEVEAAFSRAVLDQILQNSIPDNCYTPSKIYSKMLQLSWRDIFTTNYDTLIERACSKIATQRYQVVHNKEDLVYSKQPRIIKLHGSFPSERPFIITEEDYRTYPQKFAPFVNTVQQSLVESTLCLVGFSGDDPNFLSWIGWVRDNLGKDNSSKIYLIGVFDITDPQKKMLERRNITLINMSDCEGIENDDHEKGLELFFDFLGEKDRKENVLEWPKWEKENDNLLRDLTDENSDKLISKLNVISVSYPNWLITPEENRKRAVHKISHLIDNIDKLERLTNDNDIKILYEIDQLLERLLLPIDNEDIKTYINILSRYNPFSIKKTPNKSNNQNESINKYKTCSKNVEIIWIKLNFSVLRYYRENGEQDKWKTTFNSLGQLKDEMSPEFVARYYYEHSLFLIFSFDVKAVKEILSEWPINTSLPFWEVKKAGLLAEFGEVDKALEILESALLQIRNESNLLPITDDFRLVSQEAYTMLIVGYVKDVIREKHINTNNELNERLVELRKFNIDPWNELKFFETKLKAPISPVEEEKEVYGFDIKPPSIIHSFSGNENIINAYSYLRFFEEAGLPFLLRKCNKSFAYTIGGKGLENALNQISLDSPHWALGVMFRANRGKNIDSLFHRDKIIELSSKQADDLSQNYLKILSEAVSDVTISTNCSYQKTIVSIVPEILSRVSIRASNGVKENILSHLFEIYHSDLKTSFISYENLFKRFFNLLDVEFLKGHINSLLDFPLLSIKEGIKVTTYYIEPFSVIDTICLKERDLRIHNPIITSLLSKLKDKDIESRTRALIRLIKLYDANLLSIPQVNKMGRYLWEKVDATNFPVQNYFKKVVFLSLPAPEKFNIPQMFKNYLLSADYYDYTPDESGRIVLKSSDKELYQELLYGTQTLYNSDGVKWTSQEALSLLDKFSEFAHKLFTKLTENCSNRGSSELGERLSIIYDIISLVIIPYLPNNLEGEKVKAIKELIITYQKKEFNIDKALFQLNLKFNGTFLLQCVDSICKKAISLEKDSVVEAFSNIHMVIMLYKLNQISEVPNQFLNTLTDSIKFRNKHGLLQATLIVSMIINEIPQLVEVLEFDSVLLGLEFLLTETDIKDDSLQIHHIEQLRIRKNVVELVINLNKYFESTKKEIPEILCKWKDITTGEDEFPEIKNLWSLL